MTVRLKKTAPARTARCDDPPPAALLEGIEQFNRQEFFEQHETLEAIWIKEPDAVYLLGRGDLLWRQGGALQRLQSPWVSREELLQWLRVH